MRTLPARRLAPRFVDTINSGDSLTEAAQPDGVTELFPFQRQALRFMLDREKDGRCGGILADEQGVGKTVETAALIVSHRRPAGESVPLVSLSTSNKHPQPCGATLICCTTAILEQWQHNELERHAPGLSVLVYTGCPGGATDAELRRLAAADVVLVTCACLFPHAHSTGTATVCLTANGALGRPCPCTTGTRPSLMSWHR